MDSADRRSKPRQSLQLLLCIVLSPELAREWLSPDLTKDRAKEIACDCGQPAEEFEWYPVSKDVGNLRNKGKSLIKSIT